MLTADEITESRRSGFRRAGRCRLLTSRARCAISICSPGRRILVTTDRLSAFDRVLGLVPFKGQVLNQLSAFWFRTRPLSATTCSPSPDPNVMVARECRALPVEVIVRGYISGVTSTALWYRYSLGERSIYGYTFPDGLHKNQKLPAADHHAHDQGRARRAR